MTSMGVESVVHVGIPVSDLERSLKFYRDVLGLALVETNESSGRRLAAGVDVPEAHMKSAHLDAGNTQIELLQYVHPVGESFDRRNNDVGATHVSFQVAELGAFYEHLRAHGVICNTPPNPSDDTPGMGWLYARDPDGITIEFNGPLLRKDDER